MFSVSAHLEAAGLSEVSVGSTGSVNSCPNRTAVVSAVGPRAVLLCTDSRNMYDGIYGRGRGREVPYGR